MLCTLDDIKIRLGLSLTGTTEDAVLNSIIAGISARFETETGRKLILNAAAETVTLDGGSPWIRLDRYPVATITSIKEASDYDFASVVALVENDEYRLKAKTGLVLRIGCGWLDIVDGIQVIYTGGYVAAGVTASTGQTALPADLREAATSQCCLIYKRKDDIGLSGVSAEGGSFSKIQSYGLLDDVKDLLKKYTKVTF